MENFISWGNYSLCQIDRKKKVARTTIFMCIHQGHWRANFHRHSCPHIWYYHRHAGVTHAASCDFQGSKSMSSCLHGNCFISWASPLFHLLFFCVCVLFLAFAAGLPCYQGITTFSWMTHMQFWKTESLPQHNPLTPFTFVPLLL